MHVVDQTHDDNATGFKLGFGTRHNPLEQTSKQVQVFRDSDRQLSFEGKFQRQSLQCAPFIRQQCDLHGVAASTLTSTELNRAGLLPRDSVAQAVPPYD